MEAKVLVLDIDGTLTNSEKKITVKTKNAIIDVMKRGHKVILASGRPTPGMLGYAKELELENYGGYLLSFNGGKIIECKTGEILFQKILPPTIVPQLYYFAEKKDCGLVTYLGDEIISARRIDQYLEIESRINDMPIKVVDNFIEYAEYDMNKCLMTAEPRDAEKYVMELNERFGEITSVYRSEPFFIEIMPKNVDKATSLDRMLESIGLTAKDAICCGDGFNDMTMIQYAGIGVAMGNAQHAVKEAADFVTSSNDHDGIVKVIKEFIL